MKRIINFLFVINALYLSAQQGSVGIGTTNPDASAILDVVSSNKGLQLPVVSLTSTTDITTIPNPKTGFIIYNNAVAGSGNTSVNKGLYAFNGTGWERMWTKSDVKTEIDKIPFITPVFAASNIAASGSIAAGTITNLTFNTLHKDLPAGAQGGPSYTGYRIQQAGGYVISYNVDIRNVSGDTTGGAMVYVQKNGTDLCTYGTSKVYQYGGVSSTCTVKLAVNDLITFRAQSSNAAYQITNPNVSISKISNN
ncbi:hypothetical protein [Chryseobacterium daecheongense]|uniref:C1q domain-containing protein n=1 Tax=Chryseobacterium daecheongense TaxID=192389 RepID=A0A3N0W520_9FLAO|nr:hypothetical protein [Chryseobacterium daecheongense]ROI00167.1 hypothetical protein EGI05_04590 [Chryseobacterium daecheongense]TDX94880.1 hypothetical protein BCF50_0651 [Chryseobacterium daecheongense]